MKTLLIPALLTACLSSPLAADTGISISVGEPGYYGVIETGDFPTPRLIYRDPVLVTRVNNPEPPVYLFVPPGHAKRWHDHCHDYGYCGRPVYFVDEAWYEDVYVPEYHKRNGKPGKGKGNKHKDRP